MHGVSIPDVSYLPRTGSKNDVSFTSSLHGVSLTPFSAGSPDVNAQSMRIAQPTATGTSVMVSLPKMSTTFTATV